MNMTVISGNNMKFLMGENKTPEELVKFLKEGALFRSFPQVLERFYPGTDLLEVLGTGLSKLTGEEYGSLLRKARNWINGKNVPQNRETLFQICFVLNLSEEAANQVLGAASDTGIHYRNPEELIYAYGLRTKKTYEEAVALKEMLGKLPDAEEASGEPVYTVQVRNAFALVETDQELLEFFRDYGGKLGKLHYTAYEKFMELLRQLKKPEDTVDGVEERSYTMEEIVHAYIRMHVPETRKTGDYTLLQKLVRKHWPGERTLLQMQNRKEDVSRKVLLLLYLVTEAFDEVEEEEEACYFADWEEEEDEDARLEARIQRMDLFLDRYGMNRLDPGNPFDFMVLYAMKRFKRRWARRLKE